MTSSPPTPLRVVVCGTTFGQVYLEALRQPGSPFRLAGILARGSSRSRACSAHYGVPLYTSLEKLSPDIDVACVVVRGALLGGTGTDLALGLMQRGVHVLQEHPLGHDELAECLRKACEAKVQYHLNSFYPHLRPVREFIDAAHALLTRRAALYVDAATSMQVCYALLDILRITLGKIQPFAVAGVAAQVGTHRPSGTAVRLRSLEGMFAGVPLSLRVQNQIDPADPDGNVCLLHRITLGTTAGELTLVSTHGPLVWTARPAIPTNVRNPDAGALFAGPHYHGDDPCNAVLGSAEQIGQHGLYRSMWPDAVTRALLDMRGWIDSQDDPLPRGQQQLSLCRAWQKIAHEIGPPELIGPLASGSALSKDELMAMRKVENQAEALF
jgi:pyochelin biosynthetic protein PchG